MLALLGTGTISTLAAQVPEYRSLSLHELQRIAAIEHDLSVIDGVARAPDGTIFIAQPQDGNVVAFSQGGKKIHTFGRSGEGPGEFSHSLWALSATIDGLRVLDTRLRRMTHFRRGGELVDTRPISFPTDRLPRLIAGGASGVIGVIAQSTYDLDADNQRTPHRVRFFGSALDGADATELAATDLPRCRVGVRGARSFRSTAVPLCHNVRFAASPNAGYIAVAAPFMDDRTGAGFSLTLVDSHGRQVARSEQRLTASPLPARTRDSTIAALRRRGDRNAMRARGAGASAAARIVDAIVADDLIPDSYPPVTELDVSDAGAVWVTTRSGPGGKSGVLAIGRDGTPIGYAPLTKASRIGWVGDGVLLMIEEQESGLQDVVLYSFDQ